MPQYLLEIDNSYCPPRRARATLQVVNGFVVGAMVVDSGCGYTNAPTVLIRGGDGNGATATATITDGRVASINISTTGCCYTGTPRIEIASPPFLPTLSVGVSRIRVTQNVVLGRKYVLESSTNMTHWLPTAPAFTAESETLQNEFDGEPGGRFFRIREVP